MGPQNAVSTAFSDETLMESDTPFLVSSINTRYATHTANYM